MEDSRKALLKRRPWLAYVKEGKDEQVFLANYDASLEATKKKEAEEKAYRDNIAVIADGIRRQGESLN